MQKIPLARRIKDSKNNLSFWVDVEVNDETEYNNLKEWMKKNVATVDRFTPKWPQDNEDSGGSWGFGLGGGFSSPEPIKLRFGFRNEEDAMAFKLILNIYTYKGNS